MGMEEYSEHELFGTIFKVPSEYTNLKPIGMGAYGLVCSTTRNGKTLALKKITQPFANATIAKRTFREFKLLSSFEHENVITLKDAFLPPGSDDIYLVTDLLGTDLNRLLSMKRLDKQYIQCFLYQILRGLKYIHSAGVIHRDLKPSNILVNANCDLKICDFGLARVSSDSQMTGYVSTRYYRAPEIMLTWRRYDKAVDIWSVGCILAEMLEGAPLFPGKDHVDQFKIIALLLGFPEDKVIATIASETTLNFLNSLPRTPAVPFSVRFGGKDPQAVTLLEKMLVWDPHTRISAKEALAHPYLEVYHDPEDEPEADFLFDWSSIDVSPALEDWAGRVRESTEKGGKQEVQAFHTSHEQKRTV